MKRTRDGKNPGARHANAKDRESVPASTEEGDATEVSEVRSKTEHRGKKTPTIAADDPARRVRTTRRHRGSGNVNR